jgi:hypothetical protein
MEFACELDVPEETADYAPPEVLLRAGSEPERVPGYDR